MVLGMVWDRDVHHQILLLGVQITMKRLVSSLLTPLAVLIFTSSVARSAYIVASEWEQVICELDFIRDSK